MQYELLLFVIWFFADPPQSEDPTAERMIADNFRNLESEHHRRRLRRNYINGYDFGRRWIAPVYAWLRGAKRGIRKEIN